MVRLFATSLILLLCSFSVFCKADQPIRDKRILLINSYDPLFPTYTRKIQGFNSVFVGKGVTIDIEYMDSKRHFDQESQKLYVAMLKHKLEKRPNYDVIITSDDNALELALKYRSLLFPGVPLVFNGLNNEDLGLEMNTVPDVTGVTESVSTVESLDLIASIDPTRDHLTIIVDSTPSGKADLTRILKAAEKRPSLQFSVLDLNNISWAEYEQALNKLDSNDAILLLSAFRDKVGDTLLFPETLGLLMKHSNVPIYHLWEHGLGQGIIGGFLINQFEQGRESARMVEAILSGTPISQIPVLLESTNQPMFDFNQLKRFNIDPSVLPENADVLFRPKTLWSQYRFELSLILSIFAFLSIASLYLARETYLRTKLMAESEKQNQFLRGLMNTLPDLIWLKDNQGKYLSCNQRVEQLFGAEESEILGRTDFDFVSPEQADLFKRQDLLALERNGPSKNEEKVTFKSDGHEELLETIKTPLRSSSGAVIGVLGLSRDITARVEAETQIRTLLQAVEQSPVSVMICDSDGKVEYINKSFEKTSGHVKNDVLGKPMDFLHANETSKNQYESIWKVLRGNSSWEGQLHNKRSNGEDFWEYAYLSPILTEENTVAGYLTVKEDITLRRKQEEKIRFQAHFDELTKLPNRALSQDRLQQMIKIARRKKDKIGVLYIDLDDFKKVNDTLGHDIGDKLLVQLGKRLSKNIREGDTVGRLGGDEFIIILTDVHQTSDVNRVANHLIKELEKPISIDGRPILVSGSVGASLFPDDGASTGELMRKADLAMYSAKQNGGAHCAFYTKELNEKVERRFIVEQQLRGALERNEFQLVYQPKVAVGSERVMGLEALIRWNNSSLGNIGPDEFIPIAEQAGAITAIGKYVITTALKKLKELTDCFGQDISMSINLSPRQFRDPDMTAHIVSLLHQLQLKPSNVEFEITEGLLIDMVPGVKDILIQLNDMGVKLAMDDFGTGYSSLSYLRRYPFDTLKIDREFIQSIGDTSADRELVQAAVSMAHSLGLVVVAEGVETEEQKTILKDLHCDIIQGWLYSKPVSCSEVEATVKALNGSTNNAEQNRSSA